MKHARLLAAVLALSVPSLAAAAADIVVHRDPGCTCCEKWAAQVRQQFGRSVVLVDEKHRAAVRTA